MENFDLVKLSDLCLNYLTILGPDGRTEELFREAYESNPTFKNDLTLEAVREFMLDLEDEHSKGMDWLVENWLMDTVNLKDILQLPLSAGELLCLRLRLECAIDCLPLLCGSDPQVPPNPRFCLSISATSEREAAHWALTSFWHQTWLNFYNTRIAMLHHYLKSSRTAS